MLLLLYSLFNKLFKFVTHNEACIAHVFLQKEKCVCVYKRAKGRS